MLFSMCKFLNVAVNKCINWCFVHLYLLFYYWNTAFLLVISYKYIALQIISYSNQAAYNCYLLPNGVTEQSRRHSSGMMSPLACIADNTEQISFCSFLYAMTGSTKNGQKSHARQCNNTQISESRYDSKNKKN